MTGFVIALSSWACAQTLLSSFTGMNVVADGRIGPNTMFAYCSLSAADKAVFDMLTEGALGAKMSQIVVERGFAGPEEAWVEESAIRQIVRRVCRDVLDCAEYEDAMVDLINLEATPKVVNGRRFLFCLSRRPGSAYRGLGQFDEVSWETARSFVLKATGKEVDIGSYRDGVYFPANSVVACVGYALYNARIIERYGVPVTGETLYVSHNQGAGVWKEKRISEERYLAQSDLARAILDKYDFQII